MQDGSVDTHHHVVPPAFRDWLVDRGLYVGRQVAWTVPAALAMLDAHEIATAIVSTGPIGVTLPAADRASKAREVNEVTAEMARGRPDRFGFFATLPLPDVDAALDEVRVAFDELDADGVAVPTNVEGRYLGDPAFEPVLDELDRRRAIVFTHPTAVAGSTPAPGIPPYVADFLLDTVRTAVDLVRTGSTERHPHLRIILSHGGGFLPYAAQRLSTAPHVWGERTPEAVLSELRRFWFDTALTASPASLPALLAFAEPGHVLHGTDWPFAEDEIAVHNRLLDAHPLTAEQRRSIARGGAPRSCSRGWPAERRLAPRSQPPSTSVDVGVVAPELAVDVDEHALQERAERVAVGAVEAVEGPGVELVERDLHGRLQRAAPIREVHPYETAVAVVSTACHEPAVFHPLRHAHRGGPADPEACSDLTRREAVVGPQLLEKQVLPEHHAVGGEAGRRRRAQALRHLGEQPH